MNIEHKDVLTSKAPSYRGCFGGFEAADKQASFSSKEIEMIQNFMPAHELDRLFAPGCTQLAEGPREGWETADRLVRAAVRIMNGGEPRFPWEAELKHRSEQGTWVGITPVDLLGGWNAIPILGRFTVAAIRCRRDRVL